MSAFARSVCQVTMDSNTLRQQFLLLEEDVEAQSPTDIAAALELFGRYLDLLAALDQSAHSGSMSLRLLESQVFAAVCRLMRDCMLHEAGI